MIDTYVRKDKSNNSMLVSFNHITNGQEVKDVVLSLYRQHLSDKPALGFYILTGTHGDDRGGLYLERDFFIEDKELEGQRIHAYDIKDNTVRVKEILSKKNAIIVLAWCFSTRNEDIISLLPESYDDEWKPLFVE
jgi:hypothetical protein